MPRAVPKGFKQANYIVRERTHNLAMARAAKEGRQVGALVTDAINAYLSSATASRAKKG